ncbi:MAG: CAP domain-containing protein [Lachnospiraceae bacterium]|nr:CAP domain-containing protein [Lachnospiraceae bacterium]
MKTKFKIILMGFVLALGLCMCQERDMVQAQNITDVPITVTYGQTEARSILQMINNLRTNSKDAWYWNESNTQRIYCKGLSELTYSYDLERIAMKRAAEIALSYDHTRPNGQDCFTVYEEENIDRMAVGENIAAGYQSAKEVNKGWREDDQKYSGQGHRRNMLDDSYNCVGIGHVYYNGTHYWVEEFGDTNASGLQTVANDTSTQVTVSVLNSNITGINLKPVKSVKKTLTCGQTVTLPKYVVTLSIADNWGYGGDCPTDWEVTYTLSPTTIATLQDHSLTVNAPGKVEVVVSANGMSKKIQYTVLPVKYKISQTKASLKTGKKLTLKVSGAAGKVIWTSSNKKIATVNKKGVVTAKKSGTVTIKAYCPELKKTVKCKIKVYT